MEVNSEYFDKILLATESSETYRKFCRDLYGTDLVQYNMMMASQLSKLEEICELKNGQSLIDLGCGAGFVTEYLSKKYSVDALGVDFSQKVVEKASERTRELEHIEFKKGDITCLEAGLGKFDLILSVDTIYFAPRIKETIESWKVLSKKGGKLVLFFSQTIEPEEDRSKLEGDFTDLANALKELGLEYQLWDFSDDERKLWLRARELMNQIKPDLEKEGNIDIYNGWNDAFGRLCPCCEEGRIGRFLYLVHL